MKSCLFLVLVCLALAAESCPDATVLAPCTCNPGGIICTGIATPIDLRAIFSRASDLLPDNERHFDRLLIHYTNVVAFPSNLLGDLTFDEIEIYSMHNLTRIDENAFTRTNFVTKRLNIHHNNQLTSGGNSIFKVLSKFVNAEEITLMNCNITEIPNNAFQPINGYQHKLTKLRMESWMTKKIGAHAFAPLDNLASLDLSMVTVESVAGEAFYFEKQNDKIINIVVTNQNLSRYSLKNIRRPAYVSLVNGDHSRDLKYLDETVFLPFLLQNDKNQLNSNVAAIDCQDCKNYWMTKFPELLKRINKNTLKCSDGKQVLDQGNFKDCNGL